MIGIAGAVGAFGGLLINLAFRQAFLSAGTGAPAFWAFLAFYAICFVVTWAVYVRSRVSATMPESGRRPAYADV